MVELDRLRAGRGGGPTPALRHPLCEEQRAGTRALGAVYAPAQSRPCPKSAACEGERQERGEDMAAGPASERSPRSPRAEGEVTSPGSL